MPCPAQPAARCCFAKEVSTHAIRPYSLRTSPTDAQEFSSPTHTSRELRDKGCECTVLELHVNLAMALRIASSAKRHRLAESTASHSYSVVAGAPFRCSSKNFTKALDALIRFSRFVNP